MGRDSFGTLSLVALSWLVLTAAPGWASEPTWLDVEYPGDEERVTELIPLLEVRGRAVAGPVTPYDLVIALDLSASTLLPAGDDIDGDGIVGQLRKGVLRGTRARQRPKRWTTDPGDTIARAELLGARRLLRRLDERWTRVSLVTFAGTSRVRARLGHPENALMALDRVKVRHTRGGTNISAAIRAGIRALRDSPPERERILVILSDGFPTAPSPEIFARKAALRSAKRAAEHGIRIYSFAIGSAALERPDVLEELASSTDGRFFEVRDPGDIVRHLPRLDVALLANVKLWNRTTGAEGRAVRVFGDGSFDGYVRLQSGQNALVVEASAPDGEQFRVERTVYYRAPERTTLGDLKRATELSEALQVRTTETELATRAGIPSIHRSLEIELDPNPQPEVAAQ